MMREEIHRYKGMLGIARLQFQGQRSKRRTEKAK